jgi:general secretion pathway protein G
MAASPARLSRPEATRVSAAHPGFTLVEILIVVVILGIMAALVVPQFTSAAAMSRENSIKMSLNRIRQQLEVYKEQHGSYPSLALFEVQMTGATDANGNAVPLGTPDSFGPYIQRVPPNPNTGGDTVGDGAVGSSDWYYNETTGEIRANDSAETRAY